MICTQLVSFFVDGNYHCDVLQDTNRGLTQSMTLEEINSIKVKGKTAIPKGTYRVTLNVVSPRFSQKAQYAFLSRQVTSSS